MKEEAASKKEVSKNEAASKKAASKKEAANKGSGHSESVIRPTYRKACGLEVVQP